MTDLKVIAFDLFGTVFDMSNVPREEIRAYLDCCTAPKWPLALPEAWKHLPTHDDAVEGIALLRTKYTVVALSNGPLNTTVPLSKNVGITWDALIPLEAYHVYKPQSEAYLTIVGLLGVAPSDVLMVTANPTFAHFPYGDIEGARGVGMQAQLIRRPGCPQTIIELAEQLGC
jgi:2-haloalkanoic acid dehalogenase type II